MLKVMNLVNVSKQKWEEMKKKWKNRYREDNYLLRRAELGAICGRGPWAVHAIDPIDLLLYGQRNGREAEQ